MEKDSAELMLNDTELSRLQELADLSKGSFIFKVVFDSKTYSVVVDYVCGGFSVSLIDMSSRDMDQVIFSYFEKGGFKFELAADKISWIRAFLNGYQRMPA